MKYLLFLFIFLPGIVHAGGFPTFNAVADVRDISKLKKLAEQLKLQTDQLDKIFRMERYAESKYYSYQNQIKSVQRLFRNKDWYRIASIGIEQFSRLRGVDDLDANDNEKSKEIYNSFRYVPDSPDEFKQKMQDAGINNYAYYADDVERNHETYLRTQDKFNIVAAYKKQAKETQNAALETDKVLNGLDDETELATLQTIAVQNSIVIKQLAAIEEIQRNQFLTDSTIEDVVSSNLAKSRSDEMQRLKNRKEFKTPDLKGGYLANF